MATVLGRSVLSVFSFHLYFSLLCSVACSLFPSPSTLFSSGAGCAYRGKPQSKLLTCTVSDYFCCCPPFCYYSLCFYNLFPLFSCSFPLPISPTFLSAVQSLTLLPSSFSPHLLSTDLLIIPMPPSCFCHFSSFPPTGPAAQFTIADILHSHKTTRFCFLGVDNKHPASLQLLW